MRQRIAVLVASAVCTAWIVACGSGQPELSELPPVPRPELSELEPAVRDQISAAYEAVAQASSAATPVPEAVGRALGRLGMVLLAYDLAEAELALGQASALLPDEAPWPYYLGRLHRLNGDLEEAAAAFSKARELEPERSLHAIRLAQVELDRGRLEASEAALLNALSLDPDQAYAHYLYGLVLVEFERPAEALSAFTRALEIEPWADRVHYQLAGVYRSLGDEQRSAEHLARRGEIPLRLVDPLAAELDTLKQSGNAAVSRGNVHLAEGRLDAAREAFEQAVAQDPSNGAAYLNLGVTLERMGFRDPALEALRSAVGVAPDDAKTWLGLGVVLELAGEVEESEQALSRAIDLDRRDAKALRSLADLLRRDDRCEAALPYFRAAIGLDPSDRLTRLYLGMCLVRAGRSSGAIEVLEQGLEAFPGDPDLNDALARVLATAPEGEGRDADRAMLQAEWGVEQRRSVDTVETLAMVRAAAGDFASALRLQDEAIDLAEQAERADWVETMRRNRARYEANLALERPWPDFLYQQ